MREYFDECIYECLGDDNYVPVKELKEFTIPASVKNIVEDGEPLPAGIQYSVLSKDLTKEERCRLTWHDRRKRGNASDV